MPGRKRSHGMGIFRATIAALIVTLAWTAIVRADDYGPHPRIREIRAALPILLATTMPGATVPGVVIVGDTAVASWTSGTKSGFATLDYRNARWWMTRETTYPLACIERGSMLPPMRESIAQIAADHLPGITGVCGTIDDPPPSIAGNVPAPFGDGYRTWWRSSVGLEFANPHGRAPTDAEMSGPGANSIYYFYANAGPQPTKFPASTLTVWCPFVLDTDVHYIIEFAGADGRLGPIRATLNNNTLTFELPAFTAPANADLRGEVDYLPYREH